MQDVSWQRTLHRMSAGNEPYTGLQLATNPTQDFSWQRTLHRTSAGNEPYTGLQLATNPTQDASWQRTLHETSAGNAVTLTHRKSVTNKLMNER